MYPNERIFIGFLLGSIGVLTAIDVIEDFQEGTALRHIGLDLGIAVASIAAVAFLIWKMTKDKKKITVLLKEKTILEEIAEKYQSKSRLLVEGLSSQIDKEFSSWGLSEAEREVALFLLKGLTIQEISGLRNSAEKTVRHQSSAIYKKTGLKGRGELQAYFLEDLL